MKAPLPRRQDQGAPLLGYAFSGFLPDKKKSKGGTRLVVVCTSGAGVDGNRSHLSSGWHASPPAEAPVRGPNRKPRACGRCVVTSIWLPANTTPAGRRARSSMPATKGQFALHSQTVQMVCHQFLANVDTARELRKPIAGSAIPTRTSGSFRCIGLRRR